jgi:small subunit ribosomal protein S15
LIKAGVLRAGIRGEAATKRGQGGDFPPLNRWHWVYGLPAPEMGHYRVPKECKYMALNKDQVTSIVTKFGKNGKDTGVSEVQVALLTERINQLTEHCKQFKKDKSSQRGLLILVGKRRRILKYLQRTNLEKYRSLIKELGLRK